MTDDYAPASEWQPDTSRTPQEWLIEGLAEEDHFEPYRFVRLYGKAYEPRMLPADIPAGEDRCCFLNAFRLAKERPDLRYVEGYGTNWLSDKGLQQHAWCVDDEGRVFDQTWGLKEPLPLALRGVELPLDLVEPYCYEFSRGTINFHLSDRLDVVASRIHVAWPA